MSCQYYEPYLLNCNYKKNFGNVILIMNFDFYMSIKFKQKLSRSEFFKRFLQFLPKQALLLKPLEHIMIEPTNFCNLRCLFCTQAISSRPKGMMTMEMFNKILPLLPSSIKEVQLHFAGEPLLNKDAPLMIQGLKKRGFRVTLSSNGTLPFEYYEKAIRAGLDRLIVSFDGATAKSYETYRRGGNFQTVSENLKKMTAIEGRKTAIIIQFIVMRHNESEIDLMKKLAQDLGVDELRFKSASLNIGCSEILEKDIIENAKNFLPQNAKYSRYVLKDGKLINIDRPLSCPWIWRTVILWNGDVAICCVDLEGRVIVGNILTEGSFEKIWRSDKYYKIKKMVLARQLEICQNCSIGDNPVKEAIKFS